MPHGFARPTLILFLALCLVGAVRADPGKAQPVTGGPTTGGNDPTGGNTTGGNTTGGNTTGGDVNTGGNVGVNVREERRYIVEFQQFEVRDETGCDLCGSDETQFIIRTADYALLSSVYGDLDSSKGFIDVSVPSYRFKRCAVPAVDGDSDYDNEWECNQRGNAAPMSFTVAAWERDTPFHEMCADNFASGSDPRASGPDIWPPNKSFCAEDDGELIGKKKVELKLEDFAGLTAPGQSLNGSVSLAGGCDETVSQCNTISPLYVLFYTVTRVGDATGGVPVDPNP